MRYLYIMSVLTLNLMGCENDSSWTDAYDTPHAVEGTMLAISAWEAQPELPGMRYDCIKRSEVAKYEVLPQVQVQERCQQSQPIGACIFPSEPRVILSEDHITPGLIRHELLHMFTQCNMNESHAYNYAHSDPRVWGANGADGFYPEVLEACGGGGE